MRLLRYLGLFGAVATIAATMACGGGSSGGSSGGGGTSAKNIKIALVEHVRVPAVEIFAYGAQAAAN